jgi:hypothetical protein
VGVSSSVSVWVMGAGQNGKKAQSIRRFGPVWPGAAHHRL